MNLIALAFAGYLALRFFDRLRLINWHTVRPLYVAMYVGHVLWVLGIIYDTFEVGMRPYQWAGLGAMFCWLEVTRHNWLDGVPEAAKTGPGELGPSELGHTP